MNLLRALKSGVNKPNDEPGEQKQTPHLCRHRQYAAPSTSSVCNFCNELAASDRPCKLKHAHLGDGGKGDFFRDFFRGSMEGGKKRQSFDNSEVSGVVLYGGRWEVNTGGSLCDAGGARKGYAQSRRMAAMNK